MNNFFEYSDILNSPIEAFYCTNENFKTPFESHWHYFVELIYVFKGKMNITSNEHNYSISEGELILLPPQAIHSIDNANSGRDFKFCCIKFNINKIQLVGNYLPNINNQLRKIAQLKNPLFIFSNDNLENIDLAALFTEIVNEAENVHYGYNSYIYSLLAGLIVKMFRYWYVNGILGTTESVLETDEYSLQNILIYIDEHSSENINIEELARMCNMSYSYFAKIFRRQFGQSCKQYIEFIRLSKVENLLLFTDMDLTSIASETGFSDCSHLIRSFKKRYNDTPKQFRLMHKDKPLS